MVWEYFVPVALTVIALWIISAIVPFIKTAHGSTVSRYTGMAGTALLGLFIVFYWYEIQRPPMRTMAETRIWYSFLVGIVSLVVYRVYHSKNMLAIGFVMASVFLLVDIFHPEYHGKVLMPALQSPWFIPHVVAYMIAYAILASASLTAIWSVSAGRSTNMELRQSLRLVYPGFTFLTIGMLLGAFWAKIAWGNYWAWDPKEIWALISWLFYLLVIHVHKHLPSKKKLLARLMVLSLAVLLITWLGIKYLPSASQSIHVYGN